MVQQCTTASEFAEWAEYLEYVRTDSNPTKEDYYLAQIALEVRRAASKTPRRYKLKQFLLKFKSTRASAASSKPTPVTAEQKKAHIQQSKGVWKSLATIWATPNTKKKRK